MSEKKAKEQRKAQKTARYKVESLTIKANALRALFMSQGMSRLMDITDIDPALKLRLLMATKKLDEVYQDVEKVRQGIIEEHSEKDKNGNPVKDENNIIQFGTSRKTAMDKLDVLLNEEMEIEGGKLVLKMGDLPQKHLSTRDLFDLSLMMEVIED